MIVDLTLSRRGLASLFFLLVGFVVCLAGRAQGNGEFIDTVWAGHPVSFAILTERGHQFVAYYDAERKLTIADRELGGKKWTRVQPPGGSSAHGHASNVVGWDSHNALRLVLDREGCLHVSGNMHVDPLVYYRTAKPLDISTLERIDCMTGERETRCTYPVFFKNSADELLYRYRDGSSGNGADIYNIYDEKSRTWRRVLDTPLLDGEGNRNAYALDPILGPDGFFHLVWMWRESPDCSTNNTLSYARSRDFLHWETSRGEPLVLPITRRTGEVIDPAAPREGLINMTFSLGFDAGKRPVVVYHRYDSAHHSQIFAARPEENSWKMAPISHWNFLWYFSGGGSVPAEVTVGPPRLEPDHMLLMDYASSQGGAGRWRFDPESLQLVAELPAASEVLPLELLKTSGTRADYEVQTAVSHYQGRRYVLRWETLPRNRDEPRSSAPPPSELRLYDLPDTETTSAARVGS